MALVSEGDILCFVSGIVMLLCHAVACCVSHPGNVNAHGTSLAPPNKLMVGAAACSTKQALA